VSVNAYGYEHPGGMHPTAQIVFVKQQIKTKSQPVYDAYKQLIITADSVAYHAHHALADFKVPGFYIDPATHRKNSSGFQSDSFDAYACALAYQLSGNEKYAKRSIGFLMAWATINEKYSDFDGPLVMAYSGTGMIMAAELLLHDKKWSSSDREKFFSWVRNVYLKSCTEIRTRKNNWADWGRFGSVLCAHLLDNEAEMTEVTRLVKSDLFLKIESDGHMPEETRREKNGIWYTYFSLAPITASLYVIYNTTGENIFELKEGERSVRKALDYLFYYNEHPDEWSWYKNPNQGSPQSWPGNLFEAMSGVYGESRYAAYVEKSRPVCYPKHHFTWSFPTLMPSKLNF
jgi:hypothetical protein